MLFSLYQNGFKERKVQDRCCFLVFKMKPLMAVFFPAQQCMAKRFDGSQQALDLNNIRTDPGNYSIQYFLWPHIGQSFFSY